MNTPNEYLLLFRGDNWHDHLTPEELQSALGQFKAWFEGLQAQGKIKGAQPLSREGRLVSGKAGRVVSDGPFVESKETIGGYFLLAVNSLDEAVAVAKSFPGLQFGTQVEVRPIAEECPAMARAREFEAQAQLAAA